MRDKDTSAMLASAISSRPFKANPKATNNQIKQVINLSLPSSEWSRLNVERMDTITNTA
jgi:hypothetical protein